MLQQIQMEKVRLAKQCDAARAKHAQMLEECCLLEELTKGLQANCEEWQARVKTAEARAEESQQAHENWVSKLEEKVVNLMGQLDAAADAPSSSSQPVFKER
jgi:glutamate synthase domain-containing protein 2